MKDLFELIALIVLILMMVVLVKWCDAPDKGLRGAFRIFGLDKNIMIRESKPC
jgi:hypothetical protein